jgi:hypothetical protein
VGSTGVTSSRFLRHARGGRPAIARRVMLHVQSNPLPISTRPRVLIKAKRT